jgi:gliding motility-associated-like protein
MAIHHNFITNDVLCIPWNNGSVTDSVWGGVGSATTYSYLWDTGDSTYSLSNLPAGVYTITVTDVNGCESIESTEIFDNNALSASANFGSNVDVICFDDCDGELGVTVIGGSPGLDASGNPVYSYLWDDYLAQNSSVAVGLCVDSIALSSPYTCIVSDASGCADTVEFTLEQPAELQVKITIDQPITCNGYDDGKLSANVTSPGTPGYSYSWNTGSTADNISNLILGTYKVTIEDANGCRDTFEMYLNEPTPVSVDIAEFDISCFGIDDGYITTLGAGGTSFEYTYLYTLYQDGLFSDSMTHVAGTNMQDSLEFENLPPGNYYVIVEDRENCSDTSITVEIIQPSELTLMVESVNETCNLDDGIVRIFPEGGSPQYDYFIDGNQTLNNENTGNSPGWYVVEVVDANGCWITDSTFIRDYLTVFLNPDTVNFIDTTICLGQSINIYIDSLPELTYSWNDGVLTGDRIISPDTVLAFGQNLSETYILTITDENNCSQDVMVDVITSSIDAMPASNPGAEYGNFPVVLKGESIEIYSDNNNCQNYTWSWALDTINEKSIVISPENTSWYYLNVEDSDGCLGYDSIYVVVGVKPYEAITPNNDGFNDTWIPLDIESYEKSLVQVFSRWGSLVFESTGGTSYQPWDGTTKGAELPVGTYYYIIDLNTGDEPQTGPITIIR